MPSFSQLGHQREAPPEGGQQEPPSQDSQESSPPPLPPPMPSFSQLGNGSSSRGRLRTDGQHPGGGQRQPDTGLGRAPVPRNQPLRARQQPAADNTEQPQQGQHHSQQDRQALSHELRSALEEKLLQFEQNNLSEADWASFSSTLERWCDSVSRSLNTRRPGARQQNSRWWNNRNRQRGARQHQRQPGRRRALEQKIKLQAMYRNNCKRRNNSKVCAREILGEDKGPRCAIPVDRVVEHFSTTPPAPPIAPPEWLRNNIMADKIGHGETSWQIKRMPANSAPGPDRISYRNWKYLDPQGIYNRIPSSWKESITILIHKRGDQNDITNWRPICLQNTLYKLYAAIIARRLADWTLEKSSLTSSQSERIPAI